MKFLPPLLLASLAGAAAAQQVIIVRDPETGQTRAATASEMAALQAQAKQQAGLAPGKTAPPPAVEHRPDGSLRLSLGRDKLSYSVVHRGADGKMQQQCVRGADAAKRAIHAPAEGDHENR